jgi:ApaG protein
MNTMKIDNLSYDFQVEISTTYLEQHSNAEEEQYAFAYTVTITNRGSFAAQLISRHWVIIDAMETIQEVRGPGVVGEQPLLFPGESFEYTSGTVVSTPVATMQGEYGMMSEDGKEFLIEVPKFMLAVPRTLH